MYARKYTTRLYVYVSYIYASAVCIKAHVPVVELAAPGAIIIAWHVAFEGECLLELAENRRGIIIQSYASVLGQCFVDLLRLLELLKY